MPFLGQRSLRDLPRREKGENPAGEEKGGFTKVKGEPKGNKTVNGHETTAQGTENLAGAGGVVVRCANPETFSQSGI